MGAADIWRSGPRQIFRDRFCCDAVLSSPRGRRPWLRKWQVAVGLVALSWILLAVWLRSGRAGSSDGAVSTKSSPVDECQGKRVFMYDLPREFNVGLVDRCYGQLVEWLNLCPRALNWGFGQLLNFTSVPDNSALFSNFFARRVSPASDAEMQSKVWDLLSIRGITEDWGAVNGNGTCISDRGGSWFATDSYMLEMIFHKRMVHYPCLTEDPALASVFFLPYYAGMDTVQYIFGAKKAQYHEHGKGLIHYLEEHPTLRFYWKRHGGHDHFMVPGRVGWDLGRKPGKPGWGTSLYLHPELQNVTFMVIESRGEWSRGEQAVPYPTSFHPPVIRRGAAIQGQDGEGWGRLELREWIQKVRSSQRSSLFAFAAGRKYPKIREMILEQCSDSNSDNSASSTGSSTGWSQRSFDPVCALVNCSKTKCGHNPQLAVDTFLHSEFCLQPAGDSPTRRSTFDSIIAGCIPVFFNPASAYTQYTWHLPQDRASYSVFIPEEDLRQGRMLEEVLRGYTEEHIKTMRETLMSLLPRVMYLGFIDEAANNTPLAHCNGSVPKTEPLDQLIGQDLLEDAFDISVQGMLAKVDSYKAELI